MCPVIVSILLGVEDPAPAVSVGRLSKKCFVNHTNTRYSPVTAVGDRKADVLIAVGRTRYSTLISVTALYQHAMEELGLEELGLEELEHLDLELNDDSPLPDEFSDLPEYDDLSDEEQEQMPNHSLGEQFAISAKLAAGTLPLEGVTMTDAYKGNTRAEALCKAKYLVEEIQDAGGDANAKYIEPVYRRGNSVYHRVDVTVTDGHVPEE